MRSKGRKKTKTNKKLIATLVVLVLAVIGILAGMLWYINAHFFVGGKPYAKDAQSLDLRKQTVSIANYERIQQMLPDCEILWNVPFQGSSLPNDTTSLTIQTLSERDLDVMAHFPALAAVDATGCLDYELLMQLKERYPQVRLTYTVTIDGTEYPQDAAFVVSNTLTDEEIQLMTYLPELKNVDASGCRNYDQIGKLAKACPNVEVAYQAQLLGKTFTDQDTKATFRDPDVDVMRRELARLPGMKSIHMVEPMASADDLLSLMAEYPNVTFTWEKTVLGKTFHSSDTEYDFSGMEFTSTAPIEESMRYFPNAEKVIMSDCGLDNETMAAFREKMRSDYKVVWTVYVTKKPVRTDQEVIHSSAYKVCFIDEQSQDLKYCEDAVVVDIGHSYVKDISWVKGMPNLKYLILTHNWIMDLTPLETCKNLVYLELYWNDGATQFSDYTPLLGCTALEDLNISSTNLGEEDLSTLMQMTWLKSLYSNMNGITKEQHQMLVDAMPNTNVVTQEWKYTGGGWREVQNYFNMRDIMGLPYNDW